MKVKKRCPECGGELDLVMNEYVSRAVCAKCNMVFKVTLRLTRLYRKRDTKGKRL